MSLVAMYLNCILSVVIVEHMRVVTLRGLRIVGIWKTYGDGTELSLVQVGYRWKLSSVLEVVEEDCLYWLFQIVLV